MKVLVVGAGSIGTRHIKNIKEMGHEVYAVDVDPAKLDTVKAFTDKTFADLEDALKAKPDASFICTFSTTILNPLLNVRKQVLTFLLKNP